MTTPSVTRRTFLQWSSLSAAGIALAACESATDVVAPLAGTAPVRALNVVDFGAIPGGGIDASGAFTLAMAALPRFGGTITIPAGRYSIDPLRSITMRSNVHLVLQPGASLEAMPTSATHSAVITVSGVRNVRISGGAIVGERYTHLGTSGEWGMGINILGSDRVTIENVTISDCWGDGIYAGGVACTNLTIRGCHNTNNRRQGLSLTNCVGALIEKCEFSGTNGTAPADGIDLEPNTGQAISNVTIRDCLIANNAGNGIQIYGARVSAVTISNNHVTSNRRNGFDFMGAIDCLVEKNAVESNQNSGGYLWGGAALNVVRGNIIRDNGVANITLSVVEENIVDDNSFDALNDSDSNDGAGFDIVVERGSRHNKLRRNRLNPRRKNRGGIDDQGFDTTII